LNNPLIDCGKPLFFRVENAGDLGLSAPATRLGDAIRLYVRSLSEMQKEALVLSARTGVAWRLASDEGAYLAGLDEAPCPLAFFSAGMVSACMNEVLALSRVRGLPINNIRLIQDNYYTMEGSALQGTLKGGAKDVHLLGQIDSPAGAPALAALVRDATAASPLNGLMRGSRNSLFTLTHNGTEIGLAKARPIGRAAEPDPWDRFDRARPAADNWTALVRRGGMTPKAEHTVTLKNDSLAERQNRLLHVRAICTLREDGVKQIEQHLYNPHGSVFHFLSDEALDNGGRGVAPDAASYVSAGIGFCFMTQFGRYAKIVRKDLKRYRVVQDTHFSRRGASGGTEKGQADPVETHVYLDTREDDRFAQTILDMAEQTCFLHAFCRTDLNTRVSIEPFSDSPIAAPASVASD
jgi:hypothetical protein